MDDSPLAAGLAPPPPPLRAPSSGGVAGAGDEAPPPSLPRAPSSGGKNEDDGEDSPSPVPTANGSSTSFKGKAPRRALALGPLTGTCQHYPVVVRANPTPLVRKSAKAGKKNDEDEDPEVPSEGSEDEDSHGMMASVARVVKNTTDVVSMVTIKLPFLMMCNVWCFFMHKVFRFIPYAQGGFTVSPSGVMKEELDELMKNSIKVVDGVPQWNKYSPKNPNGAKHLHVLRGILNHFCTHCKLEAGNKTTALEYLHMVYHEERNNVNHIHKNINTRPLWNKADIVGALETWYVGETFYGKHNTSYQNHMKNAQIIGWNNLMLSNVNKPVDEVDNTKMISLGVRVLFRLTPAEMHGDTSEVLHPKWGYKGKVVGYSDSDLENMVKEELEIEKTGMTEETFRRLNTPQNIKTAVAVIKSMGKYFASLVQKILLKLSNKPQQWVHVKEVVPTHMEYASKISNGLMAIPSAIKDNVLDFFVMDSLRFVKNSADGRFRKAFSALWNTRIGVIVYSAEDDAGYDDDYVSNMQEWAEEFLPEWEVDMYKDGAEDLLGMKMVIEKEYGSIQTVTILSKDDGINSDSEEDAQPKPKKARRSLSVRDSTRLSESVDDAPEDGAAVAEVGESRSKRKSNAPECPAPFVRQVTNKHGKVNKVVALCNITAPTNGFDKLLGEAYANPNVRLAKTDENDHMVGAIYNIALANAGKVDEKDVGYKSWMPAKDLKTGANTKLTEGRCTTISLHHSFCNDIHPHYISPYEFAQFLGLRAELMEDGNAARVSQNVLSVAWIMLQARFEFMCKVVYTIRVLMELDRFETPEMYDLSIDSYDKLRFQRHSKDNVITRELLDECAKHFAWYRKSKKEKALYAESVVQDRPSAEDDMLVDALVADGAAGGSFVVARRSMDIDFLLADTGADASVEPVQPVPLPEGESVQVKQEDVEQPERPRQPRQPRQSRQSRRSEQPEQSETGPLSFEDADRREVIYVSD